MKEQYISPQIKKNPYKLLRKKQLIEKWAKYISMYFTEET